MFFSTFPKSTNVDDDTTSENNGGVQEGGKLWGVGFGTLFFFASLSFTHLRGHGRHAMGWITFVFRQFS